MNLYFVTCNGGWDNSSTFSVYVMALDPEKASEMALRKMRELGYAYTSFVGEIKLIAATETYRANKILVMD